MAEPLLWGQQTTLASVEQALIVADMVGATEREVDPQAIGEIAFRLHQMGYRPPLREGERVISGYASSEHGTVVEMVEQGLAVLWDSTQRTDLMSVQARLQRADPMRDPIYDRSQP